MKGLREKEMRGDGRNEGGDGRKEKLPYVDQHKNNTFLWNVFLVNLYVALNIIVLKIERYTQLIPYPCQMYTRIQKD